MADMNRKIGRDVRSILANELCSVPEAAKLTELAEIYLQTPPTAVGIFYIVKNLQEILPLVIHQENERNDVCASEAKDLLKWAKAVDEIDPSHELRKEEALTGYRGKSRESRAQSIRPPLHGHFLTSPVWCALWYKHESETDVKNARAYRQLQAYYLEAWMRVMKLEIDLKVPRRVSESGLVIRKLHQVQHGAVFEDMVIGLSSVESLYKRLSWLHENADDEFRQGCGSFADLLNAAYELKKGSVFRKKEGGGGQSVSHKRQSTRIYQGHAIFSDLYPDSDRNSEEKWPDTSLVLSAPDTDLQKSLDRDFDHIEDLALDPEEYLVEETARIDIDGLAEPDLEPGELPPLGTLYASARATARHMIMSAQRFSNRWSRVRLYELTAIMSALDRAYLLATEALQINQPGSRQKEIRKRLDSIRFAAIVLVTGETLDNLRKLRQVTQLKDLPHDYSLCYSPDFEIWIRNHVPPPRNPLADRYKGNVKETHPRIVLADTWGVGKWLSEAKATPWKGKKAGPMEKAFMESVGSLMDEKGMHRKWRKLANLANALPGWFVGRDEGDALRAAMIYGRDDMLVRTQRYYTALDREALFEYHQEEMRSLWQRLLDAGFTPQSALFKFSDEPKALRKGDVGDDRVPRLDTIVGLVDTLKQSLQVQGASAMDPSQRVAYHNDFTSYLALGLAIVTGFRAVRTPIPDLALIDRDTGFMPLQEKDREDGAHARIVWIPPRMREQITHYLMHLQRFFLQMAEDVPRTLEVNATKQRDRRAYGGDRFELDLTRTLFYVEGNEATGWKPVELTGMTMQERLDKHQDRAWPVANAGRHFLRTFLYNEGCSETLINAHFGHWKFGESAWASWSAFDPVSFRNAISGHLEKALDAIGFETIAPVA